MNTSAFIRGHYVLILAAIGMAVAAIIGLARQPGQKARFDHLILRLPVLGQIARKFSTSQMARTLATLLGGGLPLVNALDIAAKSVGNSYMAAQLDIVSARVREGESFAAALEARHVFPEVAVKMAEVGESTGALQDMLNTVADFYDEEISTNMERFVTLVEPVLLVFMGIVIAGPAAGALYAALPTELGACRKATMATNSPADLHSEPAELGADERRAELEQARRLAERYHVEFIDMDTFRIDQELFRSIPADLMLRYGFVPYRREGKTLSIVVSDPTDLPMIDELGVLLSTPIKVAVGPRSAIESILKKSESSQRVLEEATESFHLQLLKEEDNGDESLTVERLTSDISPVIRLVDSTIYTAIQRRASDIHIETQDDAVHVKYRIDGVLQPAMRPIAKQFHSSIISRIKVMAELDIAEKRVPQDGRFKLRMPGKTIDFRVSIMPSVHGEDAVIRILDKESISEQFTELRLDILGFPEAELKRFRKYIAEPYGMVLVTGPTGSGKTTTLYAALSEIKSDRGQDHHDRGSGRIPAAGASRRFRSTRRRG